MKQNLTGPAATVLPEDFLYISVSQQNLQYIKSGDVVYETRVATGKNGVGELSGSECTPRGWHKIRAKIGSGCVPDMVFVGRRPTGEIWSEQLQAQHPQRDWILTRILWLSGLEQGFNRLGNRDTMRRYIYIHGCPDTNPMGIPSSHGCIKMRNADIIELFEQLPVGLPVYISGEVSEQRQE